MKRCPECVSVNCCEYYGVCLEGRVEVAERVLDGSASPGRDPEEFHLPAPREPRGGDDRPTFATRGKVKPAKRSRHD